MSSVAALSAAVGGGNGEGVGGTICTGTSNGIEVFIKNGLGALVAARFSFVSGSPGQIAAEATVVSIHANQ